MKSTRFEVEEQTCLGSALLALGRLAAWRMWGEMVTIIDQDDEDTSYNHITRLR